MSDILQEFEELLRLREHYFQRNKEMFDASFGQIKKALGSEYVDNIDEKIQRWINVTKVEYFYNKPPVIPYFEAKMLFRDGYFESVIAMSRIICEMICVEILSRISQPFGTNQDIEQESFRVLLKFCAIPKTLTDVEFKKISGKLDKEKDESKLFKSSYVKSGQFYDFKLENGKTAKNLNRLLAAFESASHLTYDNFSQEAYRYLNEIYDLASDYLHGREKSNPEKESFECLDKIGSVLFELYGVKRINDLIGKKIETAYTKFPKIHTGTNFWIVSYANPEAAINATKPKKTTANNV